MLEVRTVAAEDTLAVSHVHVRSWQVAYRGIFPDAYLDQLSPEDRAASYTFDSDDLRRQRTFVVTDDTAICGFARAGVSRDIDLEDAGRSTRSMSTQAHGALVLADCSSNMPDHFCARWVSRRHFYGWVHRPPCGGRFSADGRWIADSLPSGAQTGRRK